MKPSAGKVCISGFDLNHHAEDVRSLIGIVSHQTFLYSNLTAYENLLFYCRMYDVDNLRQRIYQVVSMVGMKSRLHDRIDTLSRGMQQRLSIARCLLHKPPIVLLDEPETGLDQQAVSMLWETLKEDSTIKRTIVFTSHSLERGLNACDTLIVLNKGEIAHQQSSDNLDLVNLKKIYQDCTGPSNENSK
jgi:heme exporter protein A